MPEAANPPQAVALPRAGFLDRAVALTIDLLLINLAIAVIGLGFTLATDGRVRVSNTVLNAIDCSAAEPVPSTITLPASFEASEARRCTRSIFGFAHDWKIMVSEKRTANQSASDVREIAVPPDRAGRPVSAFYLDDLILLTLVVYSFLMEWRFAATVGKYSVATQVQSVDASTPNALQIGKRTLPKLAVLLTVGFSENSVLSLSGTQRYSIKLVTSHGTPDLGQWYEVLGFLAVIYVAVYIVTTVLRSRPPHDLWAGTEVVRSPPSSSVKA